MRRRFPLFILLAFVLALTVAACGGGDEGGDGGDTQGAAQTGEDGGGVSGSVSIMGVWTGPEQQSFQAVLDAFMEQNPDVDVRYRSGGDNLPTVLATAVKGGNPPDLAAVSQPGLMSDYAKEGSLKPIDFARDAIAENFGESVVESGSVDGELYGLLFKAANKSTYWYNVQAFEAAGVEPAEDWETFLENAQTLSASGVPAWSIGGADGWTLTDLFENIYLRTAGPEKYDQLARHEIPWTDQSVKDALTEMAKIVGDTENIAGGRDGALQTDFPTSVQNVFADPPKAAIVIEGDFVPGVVAGQTQAKPEENYNVATFPAINDSPPVVVGAGDLIIKFTDNEAADALLEFLTTPEAAEVWAGRGGFSSLNKNVDTGVYPDPLTQATAGALAEAETFRFDLSDLQPGAFGATPGQGLFKLFQDFLANPDDVDGIAQKMEAAAARAYK